MPAPDLNVWDMLRHALFPEDGTSPEAKWALGMRDEYLRAGEDLTNNVLGTIAKPVAVSGYGYSLSTSFGSVTKANAKAAAGIIGGVAVSNANAAVRYFQIHNKATAPAGTNVPILSFPIPAGSATVPGVLILNNTFFSQNGYLLSTGVSWAISTTDATFTDSATAAEHEVAVEYL